MIPVALPLLYHTNGVNPPWFLGKQLGFGFTEPLGLVANTVLQNPLQRPLQNPAPLGFLAGPQRRPDGLVVFDEVAIQQAVAQGPALLPVLDRALRKHAAALLGTNTTQEALLRTLHTLRTAELLAGSGVSINSLYPALSMLDSIPNPLLTIYLAGAYSKLTRPEPLGWALKTLAWLGTQQALGGISTPHMQKAHEDVGKVLSVQLQQFPAMVSQLGWWLKTFGP